MNNKIIGNIKKMNNQELKERLIMFSKLFLVALDKNYFDLADNYLEFINLTAQELKERTLNETKQEETIR